MSDKNYGKKLRDSRRAAGLCYYCAKPTENPNSMCNACKERTRAAGKRKRELCVSIGICPVCGKNELYGNNKSCIECLYRYRDYASKNREKQKLRMRALFASRREAGLCYSCGGEADRGAGKSCTKCAARAREYKRKEREKKKAESLVNDSYSLRPDYSAF